MRFSWNPFLGFLVLISFRVTKGDSGDEKDAIEYLESLEPKYSEACNKQIVARWAYITNVTNETEKHSVKFLMFS